MKVDAAVPSRGDVLGLAGPFVVVGVALAALGRPVGAAAALVVAGASANVAAFRPGLPEQARRVRDRLVHLVGTGLAAFLAGATFVVLFIPAWAFRRVRRAPWQTSDGWTAPGSASSPAAGSRRSFAAAPVGNAAAATRPKLAFASLGAVVLLLLADSGAGLLWERALPAPEKGSVPQVGESFGADNPRVRDSRMDSAAMAGAPWRAAYFAELQSIRSTYWPYLLTRPTSFHGTYINLDRWERKTWQPAGPVAGRPSVWLLGGSVVWGEGQRDLHTIASEVSRLAAADHLPIDAHNFGQRDWVSYQEVSLYDQLLADPGQPKPDVALFLDGADDVAAQAQHLPGGASASALAVPVHLGLDQVVLAQDPSGASAAAVAASASNPIRATWGAYLRHSLAAKAVRGVHGLVGAAPAGAEPSARCGATCPAIWGTADIGPDAVHKAIAVYRQNRAMAADISRRRGVVARFFWQPANMDVSGYREAATRVGPPTIDLTAVLDGHQDDHLDAVDVNEAGARRVAAAIYARLRPDLVRWYRSHGHRP